MLVSLNITLWGFFLIETIGLAVAKGAGVKLGKDVALSLINKVHQFLDKNKTAHGIRELESLIHPPTGQNTIENNVIKEKIYDRYLKFRTLIQPETRVFVDDIYHPLSLKYKERNGITHKVDDEQMLFLDKITIIVGKAGQGKTTTLRKIVLREMLKEDGYIPLIITLRTVEWKPDEEINIYTVVSNEFSEIGLSIHQDAVPALLQSKSVLLCFDGFDEVPFGYRDKALRLIRRAHHEYNSPCIVTTRPNTEILYEQGGFEIAELLDLQIEEVVKIIKNNKTLDSEYRKVLIEALHSTPDLNSVLVTPLLVDVYMSVFGNLKSTPKSEIDFYDELFWALINKHDRFKAFIRPSKSGLTFKQLYKVFLRASAAIALKYNTLSFSEHVLEDIFSTCANKLKYEDHKNASHLDIVDKTSLIIVDGDELTYIHKTILEYHTAVWIKSLPTTQRGDFYKHLADNYDQKFENILRYSSKIDSALFYEYFAKYIINKTAIMQEVNNGKLSELILSLLTPFNVIKLTPQSDSDDYITIPDVDFDDAMLTKKTKSLIALGGILDISFDLSSGEYTLYDRIFHGKSPSYLLDSHIPHYDVKNKVYNDGVRPEHSHIQRNYKLLDIVNYGELHGKHYFKINQIDHIKSLFIDLLERIEIMITEHKAESYINDLI